MTGWLFAHQGGWDEILLVATPIAIFAILLWLANHRASRKLEDETRTSDGNVESEQIDGSDS